MFKRYLMVLAMVLALPAFANAWYVNAKTSTTGQGTISPSGSTYYAAGVNSNEYTVAPAAGYTVSRVTLDGYALAANGNGKYVAPYLATKSWRNIVAYFTAASYNITTSVTGSGTIREDNFESLTKIPAGSARQLLVIPNPGSTISGVTAAGATITDNANGSKTVVYSDIQANQTVSATFAQTVVFNASAGADKSVDGPGSAYAVNLVASATSNQGAITYAWTGTGLVFGTPTDVQTTVYSNTPGSYSVTLTATSGAETRTDTVAVTVLDGKAYYLNQCTVCHSNNNPTLVANYTAGAHGVASGHTTGTCQRCHATDGAIKGFEAGWTGGYTDVVGNTTVKDAIWTPVAPVVSAAGIACAVCHTPHSGLRPVNTYVSGAVAAWDPNQNGSNTDQYDLCTGCHTITDNAGALVGNYHDGGSINVTRTLSDSHYDNPATAGDTIAGVLGIVEGYVVRKNSANPCADCHNLHSANVGIQEAWAGSAHAGKIAAKKDVAARAESIVWFNTTYPTNAAAPVSSADTSVTIGTSTRTVLEHFQRNAAGVAFYKTVGATDDADGNAWTHYNWDQPSRSACQHCHTATGAASYLKAAAAGTVYDATKNDFSHLSGWNTTAGSSQQELLYCWGCHSDAQTGVLNATGAIKLDYNVNGAALSFTAPDGGKSAACISCHSGRGNANTLLGTNLMDPSGAAISSPATKSHYLAAGLTINQATFNAGYTFGLPAASYADQAYYAHKTLGCAECHMSSADSHSFEVVEKDAAGVITALVSTKCVECHDGAYGYALTATDLTNANGTFTAAGAGAFIEEEAEGYHGALEVLKAALVAKGLSVTDSYPYVGGTFANQGVSGAAYNYSYLHHEPGAYAHNRYLAKRLIFDSLDWLDDYQMNNSVVLAAPADPAGIWFGAAPDGSVVRP